MVDVARRVDGITFVDLYAEYPRFEIDVDKEQSRLLEHDIVLFQFPMFWYSTPALIKEWLDLVLEHGFAYGEGGDNLVGKQMMLAVTAAGPAEAYAPGGYQRHDIRIFLTPLEQTAGLCGMHFPAPYVLFGALKAQDSDRIALHAGGYRNLLQAMRDGLYDFDAARLEQVITFDALPILKEG